MIDSPSYKNKRPLPLLDFNLASLVLFSQENLFSEITWQSSDSVTKHSWEFFVKSVKEWKYRLKIVVCILLDSLLTGCRLNKQGLWLHNNLACFSQYLIFLWNSVPFRVLAVIPCQRQPLIPQSWLWGRLTPRCPFNLACSLDCKPQLRV